MKITKTTFKNFIKNNKDKLFIKVTSAFDGMIDGHRYNQNATFKKVETSNYSLDNTMGIDGVWLVGSSRDYFDAYDDGQFKGIECDNACRSFIIAVKG